ncbi:hypothetical protein EV702DRAFT_1045486 [Suillus placidus]|uniref:Uncharacterized protein n=1 Tax=Suillus placidus TaxID=48579 RepID=A0A9P6ZWA7_9AGAM|nr:hypothetical protein EV702DRAFT_1045486 [Suillus placidus]
MADLIRRRLSFNIDVTERSRCSSLAFGLAAGALESVTICLLMVFDIWPVPEICQHGMAIHIIYPVCLANRLRFLVVQGRDEEAIKVLEHIAKRNGRSITLKLKDLQAVSGDTTSQPALNLSTSVRNAFSDMSSHVRPLFSSRRLAALTIMIWGCSIRFVKRERDISQLYDHITLGIPGSFIACAVVDYTRGIGRWLIAGRKLALAVSIIMTGLFLFLFTMSRTKPAVLGYSCASSLTQNAVRMYGVLYAYASDMLEELPDIPEYPSASPWNRRHVLFCAEPDRRLHAPLIKISTAPIGGSTSAATAMNVASYRNCGQDGFMSLIPTKQNEQAIEGNKTENFSGHIVTGGAQVPETRLAKSKVTKGTGILIIHARARMVESDKYRKAASGLMSASLWISSSLGKDVPGLQVSPPSIGPNLSTYRQPSSQKQMLAGSMESLRFLTRDRIPRNVLGLGFHSCFCAYVHPIVITTLAVTTHVRLRMGFVARAARQTTHAARVLLVVRVVSARPCTAINSLSMSLAGLSMSQHAVVDRTICSSLRS